MGRTTRGWLSFREQCSAPSAHRRVRSLRAACRRPASSHSRRRAQHGRHRRGRSVNRPRPPPPSRSARHAGIALDEEHRFVAGNGPRKRPVGQCVCRDTGLIEAREIVPVPRQAFAPPPFPTAIDMNGSRFLPESPLRPHDGRMCLRKDEIGQVRCRVANGRPGGVRFAGRAGAELDHDLGTHESGLLGSGKHCRRRERASMRGMMRADAIGGGPRKTDWTRAPETMEAAAGPPAAASVTPQARKREACSEAGVEPQHDAVLGRLGRTLPALKREAHPHRTFQRKTGP